MLDAIKKMAAEFLGIGLRELRTAREALHVEVASDDGRYAARTQLTHPEGSTTPLNDAADRAQQAFAKVRETLEAELPKVMHLLLAYEVAQQRRDEAGAARDRHWDVEMTRRSSGLHPKVDDYFRRLFKHGVGPHNLAQHRDEDVAILGDLHRWKAEDPKYLNPDNPWRLLYNIYATRLIAVPGSGRSAKRSVVGVPVRTKRYAADKWYMFNEVVAQFGTALVIPSITPTIVSPPLSSAAPVVVPSVSLQTASVVVVAPAVPAPRASAEGIPAAEEAPSPTSIVEEDAGMATEVGSADGNAEAGSLRQLSHGRAFAIAEALYERDAYRIGIFWPKEGVARDDYTPETLIPALQRWVASDDNWIGAENFLAAALAGHAREFIDGKRSAGISRLAAALIQRDEESLAQARRHGFEL